MLEYSLESTTIPLGGLNVSETHIFKTQYDSFSFFSLVADLSPELAAMLLAVVIGGYTLIGGLGATFYVSYFNTALIFFLIILLMVEVRVKHDIDSIIIHILLFLGVLQPIRACEQSIWFLKVHL